MCFLYRWTVRDDLRLLQTVLLEGHEPWASTQWVKKYLTTFTRRVIEVPSLPVEQGCKKMLRTLLIGRSGMPALRAADADANADPPTASVSASVAPASAFTAVRVTAQRKLDVSVLQTAAASFSIAPVPTVSLLYDSTRDDARATVVLTSAIPAVCCSAGCLDECETSRLETAAAASLCTAPVFAVSAPFGTTGRDASTVGYADLDLESAEVPATAEVWSADSNSHIEAQTKV